MIYIKLYGYFNPYENGNNNVLAEIGQFQVFFTFFGGMVMYADGLSKPFREFMGFFLVAINLSVILAIGYFQHMNSKKALEKQKTMQAKVDAQLKSKLSMTSFLFKPVLSSNKNNHNNHYTTRIENKNGKLKEEVEHIEMRDLSNNLFKKGT